MKRSSKQSASNKARAGLLSYLSHKPAFYGLIRTQEIFYFTNYWKHTQDPILDLGCGDGFFAKLAYHDLPISLGIDIVGSDIKNTPQCFQQTCLYDGDHFPVKSKSINTIISNCVFEHIKNIDQVIGECARVTKTNGVLITSVMTDQWEKHLTGSKILGSRYTRMLRKKQVHTNLFSKKKWQTTLENQGYKIVEIKGYLNKKTIKYLELAHFASSPSLATKKITGNWHVLKNWHHIFNINKKIEKLAFDDLNTPIDKAGALFIVAQKVKQPKDK